MKLTLYIIHSKQRSWFLSKIFPFKLHTLGIRFTVNQYCWLNFATYWQNFNTIWPKWNGFILKLISNDSWQTRMRFRIDVTEPIKFYISLILKQSQLWNSQWCADNKCFKYTYRVVQQLHVHTTTVIYTVCTNTCTYINCTYRIFRVFTCKRVSFMLSPLTIRQSSGPMEQ